MAGIFKIRSKLGLTYKMILYIYVSILVIFVLCFYYTSRITREIVVENLKSKAEYLTTSTVSKIERVLGSIQRVPDNFADILEQKNLDEEQIKQIIRMMVILLADCTYCCYKTCSRRKPFCLKSFLD